MKKFLVLYESSVGAVEQMKAPPEQAKAGMEAWMKWMKTAGKAIIDAGAPLDAAAVVKGSTTTSAARVVGYSILETESKQEVLRLLENHPHFKAPGAGIEVLEFIRMSGAD